MARPRSDTARQMIAAADRADELRGTIVLERDGEPASAAEVAAREEEGRAIEALALRMAGLSVRQIAERMGVDEQRAFTWIEMRLGRLPARRAEAMRELENHRLDRLMVQHWTKALQGDPEATKLVLSIIEARRRMNGLDAPKAISLSVNIQAEMHRALEELRSVVLSEVVDDEDR